MTPLASQSNAWKTQKTAFQILKPTFEKKSHAVKRIYRQGHQSVKGKVE